MRFTFDKLESPLRRGAPPGGGRHGRAEPLAGGVPRLGRAAHGEKAERIPEHAPRREELLLDLPGQIVGTPHSRAAGARSRARPFRVHTVSKTPRLTEKLRGAVPQEGVPVHVASDDERGSMQVHDGKRRGRGV